MRLIVPFSSCHYQKQKCSQHLGFTTFKWESGVVPFLISWLLLPHFINANWGYFPVPNRHTFRCYCWKKPTKIQPPLIDAHKMAQKNLYKTLAKTQEPFALDMFKDLPRKTWPVIGKSGLIFWACHCSRKINEGINYRGGICPGEKGH